MSNYSSSLDDDVSLPRADAGVSEISPELINAIRSAIFAIESAVGVNPQGTASSLAARIGISIAPNGSIIPSALAGIGLVYLPITDAQISATAAIQESKIALAYTTSNLYNMMQILNNSIDIVNGFISLTGVKVEPHIAGTEYNHLLQAIHIDSVSAAEYTNRFLTNRNTTNANTLLLDINYDIQTHEQADGTSPTIPFPISSFNTISGQSVPSNFAHAASGVFVDSSTFSTIPVSNNNVQSLAEYIDSSSLLLLGSRVQNLYSNGISRASRSTVLTSDGYAENVVPVTPVTTYLLGVPPGPQASMPIDDINIGDDIILFNPIASTLSSAIFDSQFAQVKPSDIITVNYGIVLTSDGYQSVTAQFAIDSVKAIITTNLNTASRIYAVRIIGKNLYTSTNATARIDKSLFHTNQYGVLAASRAPALNSNGQNAISPTLESLIISEPKGATALGIGFSPSLFDSGHYNLYLTLYPDGNPSDKIINLPAIDVTGNKGSTPGAYTLDSIVNATNLAFRAPGYNYRFIAYEYQGNFGISLADSYNNASFSIISGIVDGYGNYNPSSNSSYPQNAIDGYLGIDPLGFGPSAANVASPPYSISYSTPEAAFIAPTIIFNPLKKHYYYVDGAERDTLKSDPNINNDIVDSFGDGYWPATITNVSITGSTIATSYTINLELASSGLEKGKTIVVQPAFPLTDPRYNSIDYGRFIIKNVAFGGPCNSANGTTVLTVYDAVHGTGISPYATSNNIPVNIYFCDDSVSFDNQNVFDTTAAGPFKRFFEIYVDQNGHTFTHERARFVTVGNGISNINFYNVSPKLLGYPTNNDREINLSIVNFNGSTGIFDGYLSRFNSSTGFTTFGPTITGKQGEVVRFFDDTNIDYIDFIFDITVPVSTFANQNIELQLFPSLELDQDFFQIASCQVNDTTKLVSYLEDRRQFGNVSEQQFSTSAIDFINANAKYTEQNGVIRGFDFNGITNNILSFNGGIALVNGSLQPVNNFDIEIPLVQDYNGGAPVAGVLWAVCINSAGSPQIIPLTDFNPSVNSINNPGRLLALFNVANSTHYSIDSTTFASIINSRKDLTIIALANSQVTSTSSYTIAETDARKYATDANANVPLVFTSSIFQGNFQSISSLLTWGYYNTVSQTNCIVRGTISALTDPGFVTGMNFQGDGIAPQIILSGGAVITGVSFTDINFTITGSGYTFNQCTFTNCTININATINIGSLCSFIGCTINANNASQVQTVFNILPHAFNVDFESCNVNYVPSTTVGYTSSNLINSEYGFIYSSVQSMQNITINSCVFTTNTSTRFSFISFEMGFINDGYSIIESVHVTNNKFINSSSLDDITAVIAFTCLVTTAQPIEGLKLIDCRIENNICNKNQLIAISSTIDGSNNANCALVPIATRITGNSCGTIGIIGAIDNDRNYETYSNTFAYDKLSGINVSNNTCRLITTLNSTGALLYLITMSIAPITIENNNCNWIHPSTYAATTNSYDQNGVVSILNNNLRSYNPSFLIPYSDPLLVGITVNDESERVNSIIRNNKIITGQYLTSTNGTITYDYSGSISIINALVDGNICDGIIANNTNYMIRASGTNAIISNNKLYRNGNTIGGYVFFTGPTGGSITGNYFDSTTIDGSSTALIIGTGVGIAIMNNYNCYTNYTGVPTIAYPMNAIISEGFTYGVGNLYLGSDASSSNAAFLPLTNLPNGATLSSIQIFYAYSGSPASGNFNQIDFIGVTGTTVSVITSSAFNLAGSSPGSITISPGAVLNTQTTSYYLTISDSSSETATVHWFQPVFSFT